MKKINFTKGNWEESLIYAYTYRFDITPTVTQGEGYVVNATDPGKKLSNSVTITFKNATSAFCYIKGEETKVKLTEDNLAIGLSSALS